MKKINFSTKAGVLEALKKIMVKAKVLPLYKFYVRDYKLGKQDILNASVEKFNTPVIVRSSCAEEDNQTTANAGKFVSVLNVSCNDNAIEEAINAVITSYPTDCDDDEVLIQPMLQDVIMSGVVFTSDIDNFSPYYIVNYDTSGDTDTITAGKKSDSMQTFIAHKSLTFIEDERMMQLLEACKECEEIFDNLALDIEFAFDKKTLYILQVRPIVKNYGKENLYHLNLENDLDRLYEKIEKLNAEHPKLIGQKTLFGVMPDWNPAEIIGNKPKKLSLSLYKELITDNIWAYQRDNYGYRNLRSYPLLISFLGTPFIDVRVSFNSFIPKKLNDDIATKLVNYYLEKLSNNEYYHDKVEFQIIYSCYYFGISEKLQTLLGYGFREDEIKRIEFSLLEITNNIICKDGLYKKDIEKINLLDHSFDKSNNLFVTHIR